MNQQHPGNDGDERARRHLRAVRSAVADIDAVDAIDELLAEAMADLWSPRTYTQFRAGAEIARHGLIFTHDRTDRAASGGAEPFLEWTERLVKDPDTPLVDDFMLLAEAIDSGKRNDAAGVVVATGLALSRERVRQVLSVLEDEPNKHPEAEDLAAVHLRCLAELGRALRIADSMGTSLDEFDLLVDAMDAYENNAEALSGYALYRARLSVAYAQRDLAGDVADARRRLRRALTNRHRDPRTDLTAPLHSASEMRLDAAVHRGRQHYEIARPVIEAARAMEDECLAVLANLGFHRHVVSFELFRSRFAE